jgi:hypothetical protein
MEGNDTSESENNDDDESSSGAEDGTGDSSSEGEEEEEDITQITPQEKQAARKGKNGPKAKPTARKLNAGGAKGRR